MGGVISWTTKGAHYIHISLALRHRITGFDSGRIPHAVASHCPSFDPIRPLLRDGLNTIPFPFPFTTPSNQSIYPPEAKQSAAKKRKKKRQKEKKNTSQDFSGKHSVRPIYLTKCKKKSNKNTERGRDIYTTSKATNLQNHETQRKADQVTIRTKVRT
jgi:hypothetical protein